MELMLAVLWLIVKYSMYCLVALLVYFGYQYAYKPFKVRRYFRQYPNVFMIKKSKLLIGDMQASIDDMNAGKVYYDHLRHDAPDINKYDMMIELEGPNPYIKIVSAKAFQEMDNLVPSKIDRSVAKISIGKIFLDSFGSKRSTKHEMLRKKIFLESLSLNSSSKYIPSMLKCLKNQIGNWKIGKEVEVVHQLNLLTLTIFTLVLFGEDMYDLATSKIEFEDSTGQSTEVEVRESFINIVKEHTMEYLHPLNVLFPVLGIYSLVNPFKRTYNNLQIFRNKLKEALSQIKDTNSVSYKLLNGDKEIRKDEVFEDIMIFLVGGTETSSHTLTTILYCLKKHPEIMQKLRTHLKENGFTKDCDEQKVYTLDNINNLNYLTYVVREGLRFDPSVAETLNYQAYEDATICGVKIPKGTLIRKKTLMALWDPKEWQSPDKFIPERFDPESEYFHKPGSDKARRSNCMVPFSTGIRNCPGQTFAMLEIKVAVAYLVTHIDYSIEQELLEKEGIGFGLASQFTLPIKISSV